MLHLISQSIDKALLQRIDSLDDVIFFENSIFQLNKNGVLNVDLDQMLKNRVRCYVLDLELETRGIKIEELVLGIESIDYSRFVELTENNKVISRWN